MTDLTEIDRTLAKIKKGAAIAGGIIYLLSIIGILGIAMNAIAFVVTFFSLLGLFVITLFWWFGGLLHYRTSKEVLEKGKAGYYWREDEKKAEHNIALFSRYMKVYPIWLDAINFRLQHYKGFYGL
jgi:hypothetical protein